MKVLITGGAGFIGGRLAHHLARRNWQVSVIDDLSGGSGSAMPATAELRIVDIADPGVIDVIADLRPDVVVHAAAQGERPSIAEGPRA